MRITLELAQPADAAEVARVRTAAAEHLTQRYGEGHWSSTATEKGVLRELATSRVFLARSESAVVATLRLATKKPWAIDSAYFTLCTRPLYLTSMAVDPEVQRRGIGRQCLQQAIGFAKAWPGNAIRLDAYDAEAGAGPFYERCGYREVGRVVYRNTPLVYLEQLL